MKNKKLIYGILLAVVVVIAGYIYILFEYPKNTTGDPFGALPIGVSPNCGPEERHEYDVAINSKDDFVDFIKNNEISQWVMLDNFKNISGEINYDSVDAAEVDWKKVRKAVKTEHVGFEAIYVLEYNPYTCDGFTLKMTTDGHVSLYGCCGI